MKIFSKYKIGYELWVIYFYFFLYKKVYIIEM